MVDGARGKRAYLFYSALVALAMGATLMWGREGLFIPDLIQRGTTNDFVLFALGNITWGVLFLVAGVLGITGVFFAATIRAAFGLVTTICALRATSMFVYVVFVDSDHATAALSAGLAWTWITMSLLIAAGDRRNQQRDREHMHKAEEEAS